MDVEKLLQVINGLKTRIGKGFLSNLVWNTRNRYLATDCTDFTRDEMQMIVEGFIAEIETITDREAGLVAALEAIRDDPASNRRGAATKALKEYRGER